MVKQRTSIPLVWDVVIVAGSVATAFFLAKSHLILTLIGKSQELGHAGSFLAGIFFTSIFTTPLSVAAISEIVQTQSILETALWAACGAVVGDLIIFHVVRDRFSDHIRELLSHQRSFRRVTQMFRNRFFRYLTFFAGGLVIASPLPDELGVSLLGFSRMREVYFIPLSFGFNFLGVFLIGLAIRSAM